MESVTQNTYHNFIIEHNCIHRILVYFSLAAFHSSFIVLEYLEYQVTTTTKRKFSLISNIPDLTICNLNPISSLTSQRNVNATKIINITQYAQMVQQLNDSTRTTLGTTISQLFLTTNAYYQNIGFTNSSILGHRVDDVIVACYADLSDGFASEFIPCTHLLDMTRSSYPSLFNCYSLKVHNTNYIGVISGYKVVLHLDNYDTSHLQYLSSERNYANSLGAVVFAHKSSTKGWLEGNAIYLHPGRKAHLGLTMRQIQRLGPPYGICAEGGVLHYNNRWKYDPLSCISGCVQTAVMEVW